MTGEDKKRATLDFGDLPSTPAPPVDPEAVKAVTRAAGFRETPRATATPATPEVPTPETVPPSKTRRARRKTGRTEQFATRLRADTMEAIYAYADSHEITLAETIERAIEALLRGNDGKGREHDG